MGPGPWIHVRGAPAGASVLLDGKPVGILPYRGPVSPGDHDLEVRADGYNAKRQPIVIPLEPTTTARIELELVANRPMSAVIAAETKPSSDYVGEDPGHAPPLVASPWNFILGGILAGGGLALATIEPIQTLAKDGDCANDECSERYAAGGETIAKIGIGALLAAAGVTLMIWQPLQVEADVGPEHAQLRGHLAF